MTALKIALDYDLTYSADPPMWDEIIAIMEKYGHDVRIVTARSAELDGIADKFKRVDIPIIYCNGVAKKFVTHFYEEWDPDIWIDDKPESITHNSETSRDKLKEWRSDPDH